MYQIVKIILVVVILVSGLLFHLKNNQAIELSYYVGTIELPLSVLMVLALCVGALLGVLASMPLLIKLKQNKLKLEKQVQNSEKEINNLRVIPLKDSH